MFFDFKRDLICNNVLNVMHAAAQCRRMCCHPVCNCCRNDEQAFKKTDTAQRRADMERRAQERAEAEAQRLKQEAAAAWREERENKLNALHDLNLQVIQLHRQCCLSGIVCGFMPDQHRARAPIKSLLAPGTVPCCPASRPALSG